MSWKVVFSLVVLVSLSVVSNIFSASSSADVFYESSIVNLSGAEQGIFELVNRERGKKRLNELEWNDRLAKLARSYSKKMAREGFFAHFDNDGNSVIDRANDSKINGWRKIGENLFFTGGIDQFEEFAVRGWMRSPTHRRNILDRSWTATGVGIAKAGDGSIYITQVFVED